MTITKADADRIFAEVKANQAILAACDDHLFEATEPGKFGTKWRCQRCGGMISGTDLYWYMAGRVHGMAYAAATALKGLP